MITRAVPPTGPATPYRCPRCLEPLFERAEDGTVGCRACPQQNYFVPVPFGARPDRTPALLTVCCRQTIEDFSQLAYSCPAHGTRHILPLEIVDPHVRARAESPAQRRDLAGQSRRLWLGVMVALLGFVAVVALVLANRR